MRQAKIGYRNPKGGLTPNAKIVRANRGFSPSNLNIGKQQPSSRNVFQYLQVLPSATTQTKQYFENVSQSPFPFANINDNKFNAGESLAVERMFLTMMIVDNVSGAITGLKDFDYSPITEKFYCSLLNVYVDNNRVIKDLSVTSFKGQFNYTAKFAALAVGQPTVGAFFTETTSHCVYELDDVLVIPEQIVFTATLQLPSYPAAAFGASLLYIGLFFEGLGALVSPKHNF